MKFVFIFLFIVSCGQLGTSQKYKRRNLSEYYIGSGVIQYFLPNLPKWANFSTSGKCSRSESTRYFDYSKLRQSFKLSYEQAVQFQYMFNQDSEELKKSVKLDYLLFKDEEQVFFDTSDKVQAGIKAFRAPKYKRVHLIWVDKYLSENKSLASLKNSKILNEGHPVVISFCKSFFELKSLLRKNGLTEENIRIIPSEMFSPFVSTGQKSHSFVLEVNKFFRPDQELILFLPKGEPRPYEINGKFKLQYF